MHQLFPILNIFSPEIVWGVFPRLLGAVYFIAIASLFTQILPLAGSNGLRPVKLQLQKLREDYPTARRFAYFPTLLWFHAEDWFLRALVVVGSGAALLVVYGGTLSGVFLLTCWIVYLSLDVAVGFVYPWDSLLLESGFLALFLPPTNSLPAIVSTALPLPIAAFAFRWLIFRVMFGFGKFKFIGTNRKERLYLKSFLINQPIPSPLGWYASRLPGWVAMLAQAFLFVVEMILPFLIFFGGDFRIIAALGITALMVGIQLTGNFGFFNLLVVSLCVTLLDSHASIFDQSIVGIFSSWNSIAIHAILLIWGVGGLVNLPFNSWCTQSWMYWPALVFAKPEWLTRIIAFYRELLPFRVVHSYGVFPPTSSPSTKWIPVIEGSQDGLEWKAYHYRYFPSSPESPPKFIAPYHPRLDHNTFYEAFGTSVSNFLGSTFSTGNPYAFSHVSGLETLVQRLLEGNKLVVSLFADDPFPDSPPKLIRVNCYALFPTDIGEPLRTGKWWDMRYIGPHLPPVALDSTVQQQTFVDPELFHWDEIVWKERSPRLKSMMALSRGGRDTDSILLQTVRGLTVEHLDRFWNAFVPCLSQANAADWSTLPPLVHRLREEYTPDQLRLFEKLFADLSLLLWAKLEPYYAGKAQPALEIESFFHVGLLAYMIIAKGRDLYQQVMGDPSRAIPLAHEMTTPIGLYYMAIFWYDVMVYHARKFRLVDQFNTLSYTKGLPGFTEAVPFLKEQFIVDGEECLPLFVRRVSNGEWLLVEDYLTHQVAGRAIPTTTTANAQD